MLEEGSAEGAFVYPLLVIKVATEHKTNQCQIALQLLGGTKPVTQKSATGL